MKSISPHYYIVFVFCLCTKCIVVVHYSLATSTVHIVMGCMYSGSYKCAHDGRKETKRDYFLGKTGGGWGLVC